MKNILMESTKVASYLLWEKTKHGNALNLWYCCESIALYLEKRGITTMVALEEIIYRNKKDREYTAFVKNISYRIYACTKEADHLSNWFISEVLLVDYEWCRAIVNMAYIFRAIREGKGEATVRSEFVNRDLENK